MKLADWARKSGISYTTAWRWVKDDLMPVPWRQTASGTVLVDESVDEHPRTVALYARVSSYDQRNDLDRQLARLSQYAAEQNLHVVDAVVEVGSGFNAQHHLEKNGFSSHTQWQAAWRDARSSEFFVLGSKDETAGCQGCVMTHLGGDCFRLCLRTVGAMRAYVTFEVRFAYGAEHLLHALERGQALSYRFKRDAKGWRVLVSTAVIAPKRVTVLQAGCIGVDQNDGFVTVSETDRYGNVIASQNLAMPTRHLGAKATTTCIAQVVKRIVANALRTGKPISIERLQFARKKAQLSYASASRNVMLSAFAYRQFAQLLAARATDAGTEIITVNPAYSSKIGRQKYARRYGLSVHMAAAFVLARRAQGFRDRYVSSDEKRRCSTREDAAAPVLVAKERGGRGRAKVEPGSPSPNGDPVRVERTATLRIAAGGIPVREGDASPSSAMRVRRAS